MSECKCNLRTRLVGDGCQYCNPAMHAELLEEKVAELEAEVARLRLTDAEREAVEWYAAYGAGHHADTLRKLLERMK